MKQINKRKRNLGFNPLNILLKIECDAYHININDVVYIPKSIHKAFRHDLSKPSKNLDIVNSVAYAEIYYFEQYIKVYEASNPFSQT